MTDDRTTEQVIETLCDDCSRCHAQLLAAIDAGEKDSSGNLHVTAYEFFARQLTRAIFAYIEATTFSVKAWSAGYCLNHGISISPQERYFATDTEYDLNDKGEVVEAVAKISLAKNIRFAISMNRKAHGVPEPFDPSIEWWSCLKQAIKIRDRLTHPKMSGDLDVTGGDIVKVLKAKDGFEREILSHTKPYLRQSQEV